MIAMKVLLIGINAKYIHQNPAVYSLRAYAMSRSRELCVTDFPEISVSEYTVNQDRFEILSDIVKASPDILGISCYIWNIETVRFLLPLLHEALPDTPIYLGGPEVSYHPMTWISEFPYLLGVMVGESEETFFEFCLRIHASSTESVSGLPGFFSQKSPESFSPRPEIDMDTIPFFYNEWKDDETLGPFRNRILYYESMRGCPFRCSYCLSSVEKKLRFRSFEKVFPELQFFLDRKVPQVKFIDRTFNCDRERANRIFRYLKDHDNGITNFHFEIAGDLLTDDEIDVLNSMRKGLVQLEIGVQSTNPETLRAIHRETDLKRLKSNVARLHETHTARLHLDLIAGLPYENYERFCRSFNDLYEMKPDDLQLGFLKVLKGTPMENEAGKFGIVYRSVSPFTVIKTDWISKQEIQMLSETEEMLERYKNSRQFEQTLSYAVPLFRSPYDFFFTLAKYYKNNHFQKMPTGRSYRYEALLSFLTSLFPEKEAVFKELLSFDYMLREKPKKALWFFPENCRKGEPENTYEAFFRYPVFSPAEIDIPHSGGSFHVRFDYHTRDPITYNASCTVISQ